MRSCSRKRPPHPLWLVTVQAVGSPNRIRTGACSKICPHRRFPTPRLIQKRRFRFDLGMGGDRIAAVACPPRFAAPTADAAPIQRPVMSRDHARRFRRCRVWRSSWSLNHSSTVSERQKRRRPTLNPGGIETGFRHRALWIDASVRRNRRAKSSMSRRSVVVILVSHVKYPSGDRTRKPHENQVILVQYVEWTDRTSL
jgi:hypothetical protein